MSNSLVGAVVIIIIRHGGIFLVGSSTSGIQRTNNGAVEIWFHAVASAVCDRRRHMRVL